MEKIIKIVKNIMKIIITSKKNTNYQQLNINKMRMICSLDRKSQQEIK